VTAPGGRVLVVDDEELIRTLILRHLTGRGLACETAADGRHAVALASTGAFDVVLSDIEMPGLDGIGLSRELSRTAPSVPVILLSGKVSVDHAVRAMRYGVCDLLLKPFHLDALDEAIDRAMKRRRAFREADEYRRVLQKRIEELAAGAEASPQTAVACGSPDVDALLAALVDSVESRGASPKGHGRRTRALVVEATKRLALPPEEVIHLVRAALVHDVGLSNLPDSATWPQGVRSAEDDALHRQHPLAGAEILRRAPTLGPTAKLVEGHHEHFDGRGYPRGIRGDALPFAARLLAAAVAAEDFLCEDATRGRPELEEFLRLATGTRFAPDAVAALLAVPAEEFERIWADRETPAPV
jgi:putative two-component system response regulator